MIKNPHSVALVVDPLFGERLAELSSRVHVWIVDTPTNRAVAERIWREAGGVASLERGITTFKADAQSSRADIAAAQLPSIDLHHGEYSHSPPWSVIEIYGTNPTPGLVIRLREFGLTEITHGSGFFMACAPAAGAG